MKNVVAIALIAFGVTACDASHPVAPTQSLTVRSPALEKLSEGTQVLASLPGDLSLVGSTFVVKGDGNGNEATCVTGAPLGVVLHLATVTLAGGGADPVGGRTLNYSFSTPMPKGTQFRIIEWAGGYCAGNPVFVAEVVNGS